MQYKLFAVVVLSIFCLHHTQATLAADCGSYFSFDNVDLEGCDDQTTPCPLYIGQHSNFSFTLNTGVFNIDGDLANDVAFYITSGDIKFNLTATPQSPCDVLQCPLNVNYSAKYSGDIYVSTIYPPLKADMKWILETADLGEQLLCIQIPIFIQDKVV